MKPWARLREAKTADGQTISLSQRDGEYSLKVNGAELMSTRRHASEERLAELVCAGLAKEKNPRVLIGGLGFGFTLAAALRVLPKGAKVLVAELVPEIVGWNQDPTYNLAAGALADPRTQVVMADVHACIAAESHSLDGIIMDVDNGPEALVVRGNASLYQEKGLRLAMNALKPGGCLGIWSAAGDPAFAKLMVRVGFVAEVLRVRAHATSGGLHTLFLARIPQHRKRSR